MQRYINPDSSAFDSNNGHTSGSVKTVTSTITTTTSVAKNGGTKALDRVLSPIQTVINTLNGVNNQAKTQTIHTTDANQIYLTDNTINSITDKYKTIQLNTNNSNGTNGHATATNGQNGSTPLEKESTFINKNTFYKTAYFPATSKTNGNGNNTTVNSQNVSIISNGNNGLGGSNTLNNTYEVVCGAENGAMNRSERIEKFSRSNSNNNSLIMASEINTNSIISDNKMLPSPSPINHHHHHHHHHPSNNLRCSSNNHIEMTQIIKLSPSPSIKTSDLNLNAHSAKHPTTIVKSNTVPASSVVSPTDLVSVPYVSTTTAAAPSQNSSNIKIISKNVSLNNPRLIKAQIPQKLSSIVLPAIDITNGRSDSPGSIIKP